MKLVNIGFGNLMAAGRIVTLCSPDSAPIKRLVQDAKDAGSVVDLTCGRRTRCVIISDSGHIVLSSLQAETIAARIAGDREEVSDVE